MSAIPQPAIDAAADLLHDLSPCGAVKPCPYCALKAKHILAAAYPAIAAQVRAEVTEQMRALLAEFDHADTCGSILSPGQGYPCNCWQAGVRAMATEPTS